MIRSPLTSSQKESARSKPRTVEPSELPLSFQSDSELWLGLTILNAPLYAQEIDDCSPSVITSIENNKNILIALNDSARDAGLSHGMTLNGALALVPNLKAYPRNLRKERKLLDRVASWATQFSSLVSLIQPDGLVIEVGGSLRLFSGVEKFQAKFSDELRRLKLGFSFSLAPTPLGAVWLSRARAPSLTPTRDLSSAIAKLPISTLRWPKKTEELLREMGVSTVGECMRLPRGGFARRVGHEYLQQLDKALGKFPDLRTPFKPKNRFLSSIDFDEESVDRNFLMGAGERLLSELAIKLREAQQSVDRISFEFFHLKRKSTSMTLRLLGPTYEIDRLITLFCDRFERFVIEEPVISIKLTTGHAVTAKIINDSLDLGPKDACSTIDSHLLVERLRTRFGVKAVHGLCLVNEHRPEAAWNRVEDANLNIKASKSAQWNSRRPLWMLSDVIPLVSSNEQPCYDGTLVLIQGPERIETGWWDGGDVSRDYYIARNSKGSYFWVFKDLRGRQGWYLHGIFS